MSFILAVTIRSYMKAARGDQHGSERALRPCTVFRKITNGFRTEWGAKLYADIRSIIETARRRAIGAREARQPRQHTG